MHETIRFYDWSGALGSLHHYDTYADVLRENAFHSTNVRWRFVPEDGEKWLTDAQLAQAPREFLEATFQDRVKQGPVRWEMMVTIGEPGDSENDPTVLWPAGRREIKAGTLTLDYTRHI